MTKNIITIDLPPHLADYCRHEFGVDNEGNIILRRSHDIGKQIYSHILTSDLPRKQLPGLHPTLFIIPVTKSNRYILGSRFLYISLRDGLSCAPGLPSPLWREAVKVVSGIFLRNQSVFQ